MFKMPVCDLVKYENCRNTQRGLYFRYTYLRRYINMQIDFRLIDLFIDWLWPIILRLAYVGHSKSQFSMARTCDHDASRRVQFWSF